ncbi:hypothetical protein [Effusibacillus consociatus]|uniref:Uncharacterized protein n=1 Tax=Effusibacillus consociatus TaxID=1117041 RepID=A0ABV9Q1L0_9BACL
MIRQTKRALEAVQNSGVKFQVGFNRRFDSNFKRVRDMIYYETQYLMWILREKEWWQ